MTDSQTLLAEYVRSGSDPAFRNLVTRYLNLVYSAAVRLVEDDVHLAEDVAQTVFADLARLARTLSNDVQLGGWLHRHTCFVAANLMRGERRRRIREREAAAMQAEQDHWEANLARVAPVLDESINQLGADDRAAIVLRFFERRAFRSVGQPLGSNEDAARMRVSRALEKLQLLLKRRGIAFSATALGAILTTGAVTSVPAGLAASISTTALTGSAAGTGLTLTILKFMSMTKLQLGLTALIAAGAATTLVVQHQSQTKLRQENEMLRQQIGASRAEEEARRNGPAQAGRAQSESQEQFNELLRLRGEVSQLRDQVREIPGLQAENKRLRGQSGAALSQGAGKDSVSADNWKNIGFATPEDALLTAHWAIHNADVNKFKESVVVTDGVRQLLNGVLSNMLAKASPEQAEEAAAIKAQGFGVEEGLLFPMIAQDRKEGYQAYRILTQDSTAPDETTLRVVLDTNSGQTHTNVFRYARFGDDWKQVIDVSDLPADVRSQASAK